MNAYRSLFLDQFTVDYLKRHPERSQRYARRQARLRLRTIEKRGGLK